jgi:hypothetical protein
VPDVEANEDGNSDHYDDRGYDPETSKLPLAWWVIGHPVLLTSLSGGLA